ncbi:flagellar hook-length control protein FliK [Bacillus sp. JCM 19041]|uniref:flagellar hook-length control protein FliK n=1 Tax=Bacillus sp. JCM 19041 TaxID=1460637 RepID=UPI0006D26BD9
MDKFDLRTTKEQVNLDPSNLTHIEDVLSSSRQAILAKQTVNNSAEATENFIQTSSRFERTQASVIVGQQEQNIDASKQRQESLPLRQLLDGELVSDQAQAVTIVEQQEQLSKPKRESLPLQQLLNGDSASKQISEKLSHQSSVSVDHEVSKGTDTSRNSDNEAEPVILRQDFKNMTGQAIKASVTGQVVSGQESSELLTKQVHRILKAAVLKQHPEGHTQLTVKLHPETLGRMHVQLIQSAQGLLVKVRAEKKQTADLLERMLPSLRQQLQMPEAKFEVSRIEEESDERQSNKEQEEKQEQQEKREENKLTSFSKWFFSNDAEEGELNDAN